MVVADDEDARGFLFSYDKLLARMMARNGRRSWALLS